MDIPLAVIAVAADALAHRYTHARIDTLFLETGAPGEPPEGSKVDKCSAWLRRLRDLEDAKALSILGRILEEVMEEDIAITASGWAPQESYRATLAKNQQRLAAALDRAGLTYLPGGKITGGGSGVASRQLSDLIKGRELPALEAEFETLAKRTAEHPRDALSGAANIVEGVLGEMIAAFDIPAPNRRSLNTLWSTLKPHINADPATLPDPELGKIAGAMAAMVDGLQGLRDDKSRAHAMRPELARSYRIEPRHARLAVNAALALTVFLVEAWDALEQRKAKAS